MNLSPDDAIARAADERDRVLADCQALLYKIAQKPSCIKLLGLARNHLRLLAGYKSGRGCLSNRQLS